MATAGSDGRIDIGSVLSRGFEAIGRNFPAFLAFSVLLGGLPGFAFSYLTGENPGASSLLVLTGGGAAVGAWLVQTLTTALLQAIIIRSSILTLSGRDGDVGGSAVSALGLMLPLVGLTILTNLVVLIGFVLLIVPGIIAYVALSVAVPVLVEERRTVTESMERSAALTKGTRWHIFLLLLILWIGYFMLAAGLGAAMIAAGGETLQPVIEAAAAAVLSLIMSAMTAALYVELRTVREGATTEGLSAIFE
jgi:uncharacterized membrane protein